MILILLKEYERTVIFRLGRLLSGGARGPGVFFIIPCVDIYEKIDLRVRNFNVPPQEVPIIIIIAGDSIILFLIDSYQRQCHHICECHHVLQGQRSDMCCH